MTSTNQKTKKKSTVKTIRIYPSSVKFDISKINNLDFSEIYNKYPKYNDFKIKVFLNTKFITTIYNIENKQLSNDNEPSIIHYKKDYYYDIRVTKIWYKNNLIHKDVGPAILISYTNKISTIASLYYTNGLLNSQNNIAIDVKKECLKDIVDYIDNKIYSMVKQIINESQYYGSNVYFNYNNGNLISSENDPSIYYTDFEIYTKDNLIHRESGPAVVTNMLKCYYINDKLHNEDGPAYVFDKYNHKIKKYYINGLLHRDNGPAIESSNATYSELYFYKNGMKHNLNGPSLIKSKYNKIFYVEYRINDKLHRKDGPAIIEYSTHYTAVEKYYINNKLHRKDGPAIIQKSYNKFLSTDIISYYKFGKLHNENGPAKIEITYYGKKIIYAINGKNYRKNAPAVICYDMKNNILTKEYWMDGKLHNENGPALINYNRKGQITKKSFYQHGELNRDSGPVIIEYDKNKTWTKWK